MIDEIKNNLATERTMVNEMQMFINRADSVTVEEQRILLDAVNSIKERLRILNASVGALLEPLSIANKLPGKDKPTGVERLILPGNRPVAIRSSDKDTYLKELSISEGLLKRLKHHAELVERGEDYKTPNGFVQLANKLFLPLSMSWVEQEKFKNLNIDLRKANLNILTTSYVSTMLLSLVLAGIFGLGLTLFFLFFDLSFESPFISMVEQGYLLRFTKVIWFVVLAPLVTFAFFYLYPSTERKSLARFIDSELPFVVIHMGSIAGSGVEPTQIFKIVGLSKDYKHTRGEIRKLLNQVNVYGYDLLTALKNVARLTPSTHLAEVFNGLATTISSGGDLKTFFEKRAESLLLQYRIEREKFARVAETFMDLYISVVIAAPMILLLLLIMISVSGVNVAGLGPDQMTGIILLVVGIVNVIFLWIITLKQPSY